MPQITRSKLAEALVKELVEQTDGHTVSIVKLSTGKRNTGVFVTRATTINIAELVECIEKELNK